jgi:hypothetical protein
MGGIWGLFGAASCGSYLAGVERAVSRPVRLGVAAKIVENLVGSAEGRLGIDHPIGLTGRRQPTLECGPIGQWRQLVEEPEFTAIEEFFQGPQQAVAEQGR